MLEQYDVVVVGAGPAGSVCARSLAEAKVSVLLLEKRQEIGSLVRCAEAVAADSLSPFIEPDPRWIAAEITGFKLYPPSGSPIDIQLRAKGYVLERKVFDRELANAAARAGADVLAKARATGLRMEEGRVTGVFVNRFGVETPVATSMVIGADGVESQVGRWAGLDTVPALEDIASAAQYLMADVEIDPHTCEFHFGRSIAPGGYAWVFPKGERTANVGLGVAGALLAAGQGVRERLDAFARARFARTAILGLMVGVIPTGGMLSSMVADGVLLVGDAAHQTDPLTGAGIINAMTAGAIAAEVAAKAVRAGNVTKERLGEYETRIRGELGRTLKAQHAVKRALSRLSDEVLTQAVIAYVKTSRCF